MPDVGDSVLYYGDGHVLSVQAEVRSSCDVIVAVMMMVVDDEGKPELE